jgi:hypothetical protein
MVATGSFAKLFSNKLFYVKLISKLISRCTSYEIERYEADLQNRITRTIYMHASKPNYETALRKTIYWNASTEIALLETSYPNISLSNNSTVTTLRIPITKVAYSNYPTEIALQKLRYRERLTEERPTITTF